MNQMSNTTNKQIDIKNITSADKKKISQSMSWVLRHGIDELGLKIDEIGRIPLQTLLELKQIKQTGATEAIVREIVETSDKQRFRLDEVNGEWMIGANQGHSKEIRDKINTLKLMEKITKPLIKFF